MTMRTTSTTVTFRRSFRLGKSGEQFPAGNYSIETDDDLLQDVSFPAYQRTGTLVQRINDPSHKRILPMAGVDSRQLEAALVMDKAEAPVT